MTEDTFSDDIWIKLGKSISDFYEKQGIESDVISKNPEKIVIDFSLLAQFMSGEFVQMLFDALDQYSVYENFVRLMLYMAQEFHPNRDKLKLVAIKNMKMRLGITKISDFNSASYGKMMVIRATLRNITEKNPKTATLVYLCDACGQKSSFKIETDFFSNTDKLKHQCRHCMSRKIKEVERIKDVVIRMKFEDPSETSEYSHRIASCYGQIKNEMADYLLKSNINVGDRVVVTGHLIENPTVKGTAISPFFFEVDFIERDTQKEFDENISPELEQEFIETTADNTLFLEKLKKSIAPNVSGYSECKLALAIQELSGINQRVRVWDNAQVKKQQVHLILAGDPSSGKSQLAKFMMKVCPKIYFASGDQATISGLIGAVTQDPTMGGDWTLSAGALSLANGGTIAIDELNKLDAKEISKLNQVLTDYAVPIDKAKINTTVYTEVKLLGIMNPTSDAWKKDEMNRQKILQLNLKKAFTTRMTLIFPFFEEDLSTPEEVELALRRQQGLVDEEIKDIFTPEWLKKYFVYAKRKDVVFNQEELIKHKMNFYNNIFKPRIKEFITDVDNEGEKWTKDEVPSKMRLLADSYEALLSGFARTQVTKENFCSPLPTHYALVDYLLERYYLSMFFKKDQSYWEKVGIVTNVAKETKKRMIDDLMHFLHSSKNPDGVPYEDLWVKWQNLGGSADEIEFEQNILGKLKERGEIFEVKPSFYKPMGSPVITDSNGVQEEKM